MKKESPLERQKKSKLSSVLEVRHSNFILMIVAGFSIFVIIILLISIAIFQGRESAQKQISIQATNLATVISLDIKSSLEQIDLGLLSILDEVSKQQKSGKTNDQSMLDLISSEDLRHPDSIGFRVFGPDGKLRYGIKNIVNRTADFSQRDDFRQLRDAPEAKMIVTAPYKSPLSQLQLIAVARRITNPDGTFGGAIYSVIPLQIIVRKFSNLNLGRGGSVAFYHTSFLLAARFPEVKVGTTSISEQLRAVIVSGAQSANFSNLSPVDGIKRTGHVQKVGEFPYYISLAFADDDWLVEWRHNRNALILLGIILTGILMFGMATTLRLLSRWKQSLSKLSEAMPQIVWTADADGRNTYFNQQWMDYTGLTLEESLDHGWNNAVHQDDQQRASDTWENAVRNNNAFSLECRLRRRDGIYLWWLIRGAPSTNGKGIMEKWIGTFTDIQEIKQYQTDLFASKEVVQAAAEYRFMFENMLNGFAYCQIIIEQDKPRDFIFLNVNSSFEKQTGLNNIIGKRVSEVLPTFLQSDSELFKIVARVSQSGKNQQFEIYINSLQQWLWMSVYSPAKGYFVAIFDVITKRKQADTELKVAAIAFESQEAMMVIGPDGLILRVNNAFSVITGYTQAEVIGQSPSKLSSGRHDKEFYISMWKIINSTGAWQGEIWNKRKSGEVYPEYLSISAVKNDDGIVTNYVASFTDITMSKAASEEIKKLGFFDPLTQLPNRRLLFDRLKQALASSSRSNKRGAVVFLDIDHFKTLNDTLGHHVGDLLLKEVAIRLAHCVRESDTIARLGGDEFVVLLENLSEDLIEAASQAKDMCQKILHSLSQPYLLDINQHYCTASLGVTLFVDHEADLEQIIKQADIAMYQSKSNGRNTFSFYDQKMQEIITTRANMESGLRQAILQKQFELYYQVQVDRSGNPVGAEALIRWGRTKRKLILPVEFIHLAEETGTILQIGQWVLETACQQLGIWRLNPLYRNLILSINISAKQLIQADFVTQVKDAMERHEVDPSKLRLELTESIMINDFDTIIANMQALFSLGIGFSLDDFGTGYSSLQYLKKLPLTELKIDKSFVDDIAVDKSDLAISRTIIAMAYSLELSVIAEGVETEEQKQCLMDLGCMYFQGYLFGKPMPIDKFEASLRKA